MRQQRVVPGLVTLVLAGLLTGCTGGEASRDGTTGGQVVVSHAFADRSVCEGDKVVLGRDGALHWQ